MTIIATLNIERFNKENIKNKGEYTVFFSEKYTNKCPKCGKICYMKLYGNLEEEIYIASCKNCSVLFIAR